MSGTPGAPHPLLRMLGIDPASAPEALLGLESAEAPRDVVLRALDDRLNELAAHPDGKSDDAQLAAELLHAAATRLLAERPAAPLSERIEPDQPATAAARLEAAKAELARDAMLTMAQFGGWNRASMRRLGLLAQRRDVDPALVPQIVIDAVRGGGKPAAPSGKVVAAPHAGAGANDRMRGPVGMSPLRAPGSGAATSGPMGMPPNLPPNLPTNVAQGLPAANAPRPGSSIFADDPSAPTPDQMDPGRRIVKTALLIIGGVLALLLAAGVVLTLILQAPKVTPPALPPAPAEVTQTPPVETPVKKPEPKRAPSAAVLAESEPGAILRALTTSIEALDLDAQVAQESFVDSIRAASVAWPRFAPDQIAAMQESIVEFVYRSASAGETSATAVAACLERLPDVALGNAIAGDKMAPSLFAAGVASRLLGERDMPALAQTALRRALPAGGAISLSAGPFGAGAVAAASSIAGQMAAHPPLREDAWKAWALAVEPLVKADEVLSSRVRLLALDALLNAPVETQKDPALAKVIGLLVGGVQWRETDESRRWLVRWFDSSRVSSAGLSAVMDALIDHSGAAKIDMTMRLASAASATQRAELRERIAKQWGIGDAADRGETFKAWNEAVARLLPVSDPSPVRRFAHAANLSRLSEAAELLATGDSTAAATILGDLEGPVNGAIAITVKEGKEPAADLGEWLIKYAAAERNVAPRLALLNELTNLEFSAPVAEVVLGEALRSANTQVRDLAREMITHRARKLEVVNAILEALPTMARTNDNAELVAQAISEPLPPIRDLSWRLAARRALVSRMLDLLSTDQESAVTQALAEVLAKSYQTRVVSALPETEAAASGRTIADLAAALRQQWRDRAVSKAVSGPQPALVADLDAKHESRSSLARGLVQRFAASQVGAAEMMAAAVRAEQPATAAQVEQIMGELTQARREAKHAFEQVDACEAAMLRLWMLRLSGGVS